MIFSCSMISHYMADLQEITEIANYKLESGLHDEEIVACQKSVSPPSITKEETTTAPGCHQSCALMKSLSSKSRSNSSEKLSTVKNFNELLQEQRRMLNQYKHQESDNTMAGENQNLEEDEGERCIPEWMIKRSSIMNKKSHLKALESNPDELNKVTLIQDKKCHGDESLVLPEELQTNFEEDTAQDAIKSLGETNQEASTSSNLMKEDTVMINDGITMQFMNTNVTNNNQNDATKEDYNVIQNENIESASNGKLKVTDETESHVFQINMDAAKIIHVENENNRIVENNDWKIEDQTEPEMSNKKLESVKTFNIRIDKDVLGESEDFDYSSYPDVTEHAKVDVMPDNLVSSTKVNIVHEKTEKTSTESIGVKQTMKPEVASAEQLSKDLFLILEDDDDEKKIFKTEESLDAELKNQEESVQSISRNENDTAKNNDSFLIETTDDTITNTIGEERAKTRCDDHDETLESLTKSVVKSQLESQNLIDAVKVKQHWTDYTIANKKGEEKAKRTFEDHNETLESLIISVVKSQVESQDLTDAVNVNQNWTDDTIANKKGEEKAKRTFEDHDETLECLNKSVVKRQVESQDRIVLIDAVKADQNWTDDTIINKKGEKKAERTFTNHHETLESFSKSVVISLADSQDCINAVKVDDNWTNDTIAKKKGEEKAERTFEDHEALENSTKSQDLIDAVVVEYSEANVSSDGSDDLLFPTKGELIHEITEETEEELEVISEATKHIGQSGVVKEFYPDSGLTLHTEIQSDPEKPLEDMQSKGEKHENNETTTFQEDKDSKVYSDSSALTTGTAIAVGAIAASALALPGLGAGAVVVAAAASGGSAATAMATATGVGSSVSLGSIAAAVASTTTAAIAVKSIGKALTVPEEETYEEPEDSSEELIGDAITIGETLLPMDDIKEDIEAPPAENEEESEVVPEATEHIQQFGVVKEIYPDSGLTLQKEIQSDPKKFQEVPEDMIPEPSIQARNDDLIVTLKEDNDNLDSVAKQSIVEDTLQSAEDAEAITTLPNNRDISDSISHGTRTRPITNEVEQRSISQNNQISTATQQDSLPTSVTTTSKAEESSSGTEEREGHEKTDQHQDHVLSSVIMDQIEKKEHAVSYLEDMNETLTEEAIFKVAPNGLEPEEESHKCLDAAGDTERISGGGRRETLANNDNEKQESTTTAAGNERWIKEDSRDFADLLSQRRASLKPIGDYSEPAGEEGSSNRVEGLISTFNDWGHPAGSCVNKELDDDRYYFYSHPKCLN